MAVGHRATARNLARAVSVPAAPSARPSFRPYLVRPEPGPLTRIPQVPRAAAPIASPAVLRQLRIGLGLPQLRALLAMVQLVQMAEARLEWARPKQKVRNTGWTQVFDATFDTGANYRGTKQLGYRTEANNNPAPVISSLKATQALADAQFNTTTATTFNPLTHNTAYDIHEYQWNDVSFPWRVGSNVTLKRDIASYPIGTPAPEPWALPAVRPVPIPVPYRPVPDLAPLAPPKAPPDAFGLEVRPGDGRVHLVRSVRPRRPPKGVKEGKGAPGMKGLAFQVLHAVYKAADKVGEVSEITEALAKAAGWKKGMGETPYGDRVDQLNWLFGEAWGIGNLDLGEIVGTVIANEIQDRAFGKVNAMTDKASRPHLGRSWDFGPAI